MYGFNRVFIMGNLGRKPELTQTENGTTYASLSIATNYIRASDKERHTDWFRVKVWGKQAENCSRYLDKGQGVMVEGYLNSYTTEPSDKSEKPETRIGINAIKVEFLPKAARDSDS
jgi:single-strand DNA-binding protein